MQQQRPCGGVARAASTLGAAPRLPPLAQRAAVAARAGRSPRSTVSEASEKGTNRQQSPPRPSAVAQTSRPESSSHQAESNGAHNPQQQTNGNHSQQQQGDRKPGGGQSWWHERRREAQRAAGMTQLEEFMRDTPGLNRLVDGYLILGDAVMVLATEAASERLPLGEMPYLAAVAVFSWVLAGAVLGDYKGEPDPDENPLSNMLGWPIVVSVANACMTWAVAMVPSMLGFSLLVSNLVVTPEVVLEVQRDGQLSPQLEVSVALLVTMLCWRGMAARLRMKAD